MDDSPFAMQMRYENWDVLLFPESSKVPIQEFKTQCFATKDRESPYLYSPAFTNPGASYYQPQGSLGLLPVLTTFIPSIRLNTPFRVSVHCWDKPRPSRLMNSLLQPDDSMLFEVRIVIDGRTVAGNVFSPRSTWPIVIDLSSVIDKNGNNDNLRFPPFHREILDQNHWDAGDAHGRIRVVISEGFARLHRYPPFERVKEIIVFAFQHAPLDVLEQSNIAWPNLAMWAREPRLVKYNSANSGGGGGLKEPAEDAHAHTPTRHSTIRPPVQMSQPGLSASTTTTSWGYRNYPAPPIPQWHTSLRESRWAPPDSLILPDPFIDPYVLDPAARHRGARPSWEDVSMPDYVSSSASSRVISSMTGSYEHSNHPSIAPQIDDDAYNQLIEALYPPSKPLTCGTQPPTNTPTSPTFSIKAKPSVAAEAPSVAPNQNSSLGSTFASTHRDISVSSAKSTLVEAGPDGIVANRLPASPNLCLKSRKEVAPQENKENEGTLETPRKESDKVTPSKTARRVSVNLETPPPAPKRTLSVNSMCGEMSIPRKEAPILLSPAQDLAEAEALLHQAGLEELLNPKVQVAGSEIEVAEID
ncbi:hypothetical protein FE257_004094 [Aspergillus nanangensis]|uniref:Uncharacterized protein n=1 Tax=Aspergillus nanangensis TaxID=2582783 RepID=A0AAD4CAZ2_ASPNN|nr:hypothetical protein FE257_004094 [Aspergillus nanangensis]